jgi:hypothetical protein
MLRTLVAAPEPEEPFDRGGHLAHGSVFTCNASADAEAVLVIWHHLRGADADDDRRDR